jgi:hypothetical protein
MPKSSMEELKGQIAAGQYAIDPGVLAGDILSKLALIRRVRRLLLGDDEQGGMTGVDRSLQARRQRGSAPAKGRSAQPRNNRLS